MENKKTVYPDENNVVLNENSVGKKTCINRESKSDELTIKLYNCHNNNMKFLVVVTPPSIYHVTFMWSYFVITTNQHSMACLCVLEGTNKFIK